MTSTGGGFTSGFRTIKSGYLNKRCRWSWRPRYVELISNPKDMTGPHFRCLLLIYDHSSRYVKNKIRVDDIVTVRSGKTFSFQIYLNNGMFLFFRTGSLDNQSAWMADLKMALGKVTSQFHVRVHVAAPSSCKALVLDHALLYCIGVNLPTHHSGQLDRVLVLASPVTDVNLHAWNLSRVKRLIVMEIGIQMELCSNCSGCHEKKVVMFLLPSDLIEDCLNFLLHEMQATDVQPQRSIPNDPIIYVLPHQCGGARSGSFSFPQHQQQQQRQQESYDSAILHALNSHPAPNSPLTAESPKKDPPAVSPNPALPPRNQLRPNYQEYIDGGVELKPCHVSSSRPHVPARYRHHFEVPYHISQRIYINDTGTIRHESQVLGSGSGEFRANNGSPSQPPRVIVTESSKETGYNPVYISSDDIHPGPTPAGRPGTTGPNRPIRPEFIGRRRPMLPPRSSDISEDIDPPPPPRSSPLSSRTPPPPTSTSPRSSPSPPLTPPLPARLPPSPPPSYSQDDPSDTGTGYVNVEDTTRCTSALSLCTDDITNADFALMTKVTFKNIIPSLPPRSNKQPVPTPRKQQNSHKTQNTPSNSVVSTQQSSSSEYSYATAPFYGLGIGGYSSVVHHTDLRLERPRSQSSGSLCLNQLYDRTMHHGQVSNEC